MLTEKQYLALCKYRDNFVSASGKPDDMTLDLCNRGFIRPKKVEYTIENECLVSYQKVFWELAALGHDELRAYEIEQKQSLNQKRAERLSVVIGIISAAAAIVGVTFAALTFFS